MQQSNKHKREMFVAALPIFVRLLVCQFVAPCLMNESTERVEVKWDASAECRQVAEEIGRKKLITHLANND